MTLRQISVNARIGLGCISPCRAVFFPLLLLSPFLKFSYPIFPYFVRFRPGVPLVEEQPRMEKSNGKHAIHCLVQGKIEAWTMQAFHTHEGK